MILSLLSSQLCLPSCSATRYACNTLTPAHTQTSYIPAHMHFMHAHTRTLIIRTNPPPTYKRTHTLDRSIVAGCASSPGPTARSGGRRRASTAHEAADAGARQAGWSTLSPSCSCTSDCRVSCPPTVCVCVCFNGCTGIHLCCGGLCLPSLISLISSSAHVPLGCCAIYAVTARNH